MVPLTHLSLPDPAPRAQCSRPAVGLRKRCSARPKAPRGRPAPMEAMEVENSAD